MLAAVFAGLFLPVDTIGEIMDEGGPIESATLVAYAAALYVTWRIDKPALDKRTATAVTLLLVTCVVKELGLRRPLIVSAGYDPRVFEPTAWPNVITVVLVLSLLPAGVWLVRRYARAVLAALKAGSGAAWSLALAFASVPLSQVLDHFSKADGRQLDLFLSLETRALFLSVEEVLELLLPLLVVLAALQLRASMTRSRE